MPSLVSVEPDAVPTKRRSRVQEAVAIIDSGKAVSDGEVHETSAAARKACGQLLVSLYRYRKLGRVNKFASRIYPADGGYRWAIVPKDEPVDEAPPVVEKKKRGRPRKVVVDVVAEAV